MDIRDIQITAFSTPMFSTWVYVHPFRLLIDAGDGALALLGQRVHTIDTVAITHAHRDHLAGLLQVLNIRSGSGNIRVIHPAHSRGIAAVRDFSGRFDASIEGRVEWLSAQRRDQFDLTLRNFAIRNFPVRHIPEPDEHRSRTLGYQVVETKMKLRPELACLPQAELDKIRLEQGKDAIVAPVLERWLSASGDTLPIDPAEYRGSRILLHECTFLSDIDRAEGGEEGRDHWHSTLDEVLDVARAAEPGALVLYHISQRYPAGEIYETVSRVVRRARLPFPVHAIVPGKLHKDVLAHTVDARPPRWAVRDEPLRDGPMRAGALGAGLPRAVVPRDKSQQADFPESESDGTETERQRLN